MNFTTVLANVSSLLFLIQGIIDGIKNGAKGTTLDVPVNFGSKQSIVLSAGGKRVKITRADFTVEVL